ncbi:MAG: penicillin-binding protein activator [Proteobacteria bacterium]|nr:penicillin-binding protein activator [Pseudomonadota bacterium]
MKSYNYFIAMISLFLVASCGLKSVSTLKVGADGDKVFARAEKKFEQGDYDRALAAYSTYIDDYPNQALAPAALLKIGAIHSAMGHYEKARQAYQTLVKNYPGSPYAPDAMVDILVTYYQEGLYSEVIKGSYDVPENLTPSDYLIRKYVVMGDAFLGLDAKMDAVDAFFRAYKRSEAAENEGITLKLRNALERLTPDEIAALLDRTREDEIRAFIEFQLCRNILRDGKKDEGLGALTRFIQLYARHPLAKEAEKIKEALTSSAYTINLVGCLMPTSGKYESYGLRAQMGFDLAYNTLVETDSETDLRIVYRDTESDPEKTREAVRELAELGVCAIIGPVGTVEEAAQEAQLRGVPIMTLTGKEGITRMGDFVFRNFMTREMQVKSVVSYAFEVLGLNNFAILYPEEQYGQDLMNLFWDEVNAYGGEIVGVESYTLENTDFAVPIKKLIGMYYPVIQEPDVVVDKTDYLKKEPADTEAQSPVMDFDAVFIPDSCEKVGLILPQLSFYDVGDVYLLGTNLWHTDKLIRMAGNAAHGTVIPDGFFGGSKRTEVQRFVRDFIATFNETPGFIEAIGYDSAMMIFQVVREKPISYSTFRDRLLEIKDFEGVTGVTSVDETGDVWKELYLLNADGNGFKELSQ